ncbi:MAG: hypothetical protein ACYCPT_10650 [Acidimicrobiales bacterium]
MNTTTPTVKHICGHQRVYNLSATPALLRAGVLSRLAERDCVSCRRIEDAKRHEGEMGSLLGDVAVETALSECEVWERQVEMSKLEGTVWAVAAGARVRFALLTEAHDWCSDREWTEEEFTQRFLVLARQRLDAASWLSNFDCPPWDLEEMLTRVDDASDLDDDVRGAR